MGNPQHISSKGNSQFHGIAMAGTLLAEGKFDEVKSLLDAFLASNSANQETDIISLGVLLESRELYKVLFLGVDADIVLSRTDAAYRAHLLANAEEIVALTEKTDAKTKRRLSSAVGAYLENAVLCSQEISREDTLVLLHAYLPLLSHYSFPSLSSGKYPSLTEKIFLPKHKLFAETSGAIYKHLKSTKPTLYASELHTLAALYLANGSYEQVKACIEGSAVPSDQKHIGLFLLLCAELRVKNEEEFVRAKGFRTEHPTYQKLLASVRASTELTKKSKELASANIEAHTKKEKPKKPPRVKRKREKKKISLPKLNIDFKKLAVRVGIPLGAVALAFCLFYFVICGRLTYTLTDDGTGYAVSYRGAVVFSELTVPSEHNGLPVVTVAEGAFENKTNLKRVNLPDTVTSIGRAAFQNCSRLESINLPDGLTSIGEFAFKMCESLPEISLPDGILHIGKDAFYECDSLQFTYLDNIKYLGNGENPYLFLEGISSTQSEAVTLPDTVRIIDKNAFAYQSAIKSITIPETVIAIGEDAFKNCLSLEAVYIEDVGKWCAISFANLESNPLSHSCVLYLGGTPVYVLDIPEGVTSVSKNAFNGCASVTRVNIPDTVTHIGDSAFMNCQMLNGVNITSLEAWYAISFESVYSNPLGHGKYLYLDGEEVKDIEIPLTVTSLSLAAFYGCKSLNTVKLHSGITSIGSYAFAGCDNLVLTEYGNGCYLGSESNPYLLLMKGKDSNITSCNIHKDTKFIHSRAFSSYSKLAGVTIPDGLLSIGAYAFSACLKLTKITVPDSVRVVEKGAFYNSNIEEVVLGDGVQLIGESAFESCNKLRRIVIGRGVRRIEQYAFTYCSALERVNYRGSEEEWARVECEFNLGSVTFNYKGN